MTLDYSDSRKARVNNHASLLSTEVGTVLVEFAASFGFLMFLCLGVVTLGNVLNSYLTLVQITDEAVRTLSAVPGLEQNTTITWTSLTQAQRNNCVANPRGNPSCGHILMQARVELLANTMGIDSERLEIVSRLNSNNDAVFVSISSGDLGLLSFGGAIPITIEAEGPYLY